MQDQDRWEPPDNCKHCECQSDELVQCSCGDWFCDDQDCLSRCDVCEERLCTYCLANTCSNCGEVKICEECIDAGQTECNACLEGDDAAR